MTHLLQPGCIPESIDFISPDRNRILGAIQSGGEAHWPVIWEEGVADPGAPGAFDYSGDGPDSPDWETVEVDGEVLWLDETGMPWLTRHLIPLALVDGDAGPHPETWGLSPETCRLMQADLDAQRLHAEACLFAGMLDAVQSANFNAPFIVRETKRAAEEAKAAAIAAKEADLAILRTGGWDEEAVPVDIVAKAAEGLDHLRRARECFVAAGNRRTAERVRHAISSGKGAVRAAGYRQRRLAGD